MILSILLCFLSSLLLILSFPRPDFSWLAWFGFIPLFFALENKTKKQAFWLAYLWGLFFWAGLIYWLSNVTLLGYIFLVLYLALYFGLFGLMIILINLSTLRLCSGLMVSEVEPSTYQLINLLSIPSFWVSLEFFRSHLFTGFGWAILGYSQYRNLHLIQIADITGAYGVSFLIVLVNIAIFQIIKSILRRKFLATRYKSLMKLGGWWVDCSLLATVFIVLICLVYGYYKLPLTPYPLPLTPLKVSLIQGNVSPYEKWDEHFKDLIFEKYSLISQMATRDNPDLIIWPETSFPGFWEEERILRGKVLDLAKELKTHLLIGVPTLEGNASYNVSMLISGEGQEINRYRKIHLVPFGEYIPFPKIFRFLENCFPIGDYASGKDLTLFTPYPLPLKPYTFSVLICFEDIFPNLVRKFVKNGAEFLINITEDGWYGKSGASFQHMQAAVFRALENRRFVVRVANTGYSCVINSQGKIVSDLKDEQGNKLFITGVHTAEVTPNSEKTFYSRWGDWFAFLCIIITLLVIFREKRRLVSWLGRIDE